MIIRGFYLTSNNNELIKDGKGIKAIIINKVWHPSSHRLEKGYYYYFKIKNIEYEGHTFSQDYIVGDSIDILYLQKNPKINNPKDYLMDW